MRRYLLVLILAALVAQPAIADPKDKGERGRGRDRGNPPREEVRGRGRGPEGRGNAEARREAPPAREEVRVRDQGPRGEMRAPERGPSGDMRVRERDVRVIREENRGGDTRVRERRGPYDGEIRGNVPAPRPVVREREIVRQRDVVRGRPDVRYKDGGPRGGNYGRGPSAPGMRMGQRGHWTRGPMPGPAVGQRGRVYVSPGFPIRRSLPYVFVRRHPVYWGHLYFGPTFFFSSRIVVLPHRDRLVWEDSQTLYRSDGWTDFTLDVDDFGGALYLEVTDPVQIDWAEVVFDDGYTRVVDFDRDVVDPGIYTLLDFAGRRDVQFVRLVARSLEPRARVIVSMARY